jgi:NOL1/NOP2/fmu family ribosome biogenesis protein
VRVLDRSERKALLEELERAFGLEELPQDLVLVEGSEGKVRAVTREAYEMAQRIGRVETLGLYVLKRTKFGVYLSVEGSQLFGEKLRRNVFELNVEQLERWASGEPLDLLELGLRPDGGFVVVRYGPVFAGSGKVSKDEKVHPQIPKDRRVLVE